MKNLFNNRKSLALTTLLVIGLINISFAQFTSSYTGKASVSATDLIYIKANHVKDLVVNTTESEEVSFKVTITLNGDSPDGDMIKRLQKSIHYQLEQKPGEVAMDFKRPFKSYKQVNGWFFGSSTKIELYDGQKFEFDGKLECNIAIEVNMPQQNDLTVKGSFSGVGLGYLAGNTIINMEHSTIKANDLGTLDLKTSFSNVDFGNIIGAAQINLSHSKLSGLQVQMLETKMAFSTMELSGATKVTSKNIQHSTLKIKTADKVDIASAQFSTLDVRNLKVLNTQVFQHGKIALETVDTFKLTAGAFTKILIGSVSTSVEVNASYCDTEIKNIFSTITTLKIENQFATVSLNTAEITDFDLYVSNGQFTKVKSKGDGIVQKSDGYFQKRLASNKIVTINIECPHCTVDIN